MVSLGSIAESRSAVAMAAVESATKSRHTHKILYENGTVVCVCVYSTIGASFEIDALVLTMCH